MATETLPGPIGEIRAASTASGGTALSTTAVVIPLWLGTKQVSITGRNFSTAVVARVNTNPWVTVLKTTDALVAESNLTDLSTLLQDNATTAATIGALPTAGFIYVGSYVPFSGLKVTHGTANTVTSTLSANYWNGAWTSLSITDGTAATSKTLAQDGSITWTVPTDWATTRLFDAGDTKLELGQARQPLYWVRFQVSVALSAGTTLQAAYALNRDTHYAELQAGTVPFEFACTVGEGGIASLTAATDAGTANLLVNCATRAGGRFA